MTSLLDVAQLGAHLDRFERRLFRWETLPAYAVESDGDDFHRWLVGDLTLSEQHRRWMEVLRGEVDAGKRTTRVRILSADLTNYELYSCHAYAHNAEAGEEIRVMHVGEHPMADDFVSGPGDFWVVDDAEALQNDERGAFLGAEVLDDLTSTARRHTRDLAWKHAEPFPRWWARHPELRDRRAA